MSIFKTERKWELGFRSSTVTAVEEYGLVGGRRRGSQGASRAAPGKSGVYACDEEEPINVSSHGREIGTQDALKKESRGLSQVAA